jgi:uncharacterized protein YndB with AHSA1/START domain
MTELRKTITIDASPDAVWAVLGDHAATPEWLPGTVATRMEGAIRICQMADGNEIREEISGHSPEHRTYSYRHLQVPLPIRNSSGTFTVEEAGTGGSIVRLDVEFEALDPAAEPQIAQMFRGALEQALDSLRRRVETGVLWDAA